MKAIGFVPLDFRESVQRLTTWCRAGCALMREGGRWRLTKPETWRFPHGPAPRPISEEAAQAAVLAGARVERAPDLFEGGPAA